MNSAALSLADIGKAFDGNVALDSACLSVRWGEVHALLGENGAGKSTLMNIVCGLYSADTGSVALNGEPLSIRGPADATARGIGMVHQHFKLVGPFSVAENILLACSEKLGVTSIDEMARLAQEAADKLGFSLNPNARTDSLSVAERQRIEIIKLILLGADILILDEPTAVLTDDESDNVLALLQDMARQGKAVILITHRLREVTGFADRVTIMRGGKTVLAGADAQSMNQSNLAEAMVGESLEKAPHRSLHHADSTQSACRLSLDGLTVTRSDGTMAVRDVSLSVHAGEILGVAGVGGNGQTELAEAVFGLVETDRGNIELDGENIVHSSVRQRRQKGLRLVPADRFAYALLPELLAYENLSLTGVPDDKFGPNWWLDKGEMKRHAARVFPERDITGGTPRTRTRLFSGGNAQKLLLARELGNQASVLIAHSPTRGLDVRAYQAVHKTVLESVENGAACLLISEDLDEIFAISTRVAVLSRGVLHGPFPIGETSRARVGELMAGRA